MKYLVLLTIPMVLLQALEGIDLRTLPISTALIVAIVYLWKSYQASLERALVREQEFYSKIIEILSSLNKSMEDLKDGFEKLLNKQKDGNRQD